MKISGLVIALLAISVCGCQSTKLLTKLPTLPWQKTDAEVAQDIDETTESAVSTGIPQTMLCVWKDGTLDAGNKRIRGLAGRVYFRDVEENAIKVDGTFAVYAYANDGLLGPSKVQPERKFVFEADKLDEHYSESELGPSYSFWLPWDEVGGDETSIAVLPIMRMANGRIIRGEEVAAVLPGRRRKTIDSDIQELRQQIEREKQQVLYKSPEFDDHLQRQLQMRTDTIRVPDDAAAVMQAMHTQPEKSQQASRIATQSPTHTGEVKTAEANLTEAAATSRLPETSDKAWEQALNSFRSRGAANNHRFDPRNMQGY